MKVAISVEELITAFDSIPFVEGYKDRDVVTISHPRFREDGHKIGITFQKLKNGIWKIDSNNIIITKKLDGTTYRG